MTMRAFLFRELCLLTWGCQPGSHGHLGTGVAYYNALFSVRSLLLKYSSRVLRSVFTDFVSVRSCLVTQQSWSLVGSFTVFIFFQPPSESSRGPYWSGTIFYSPAGSRLCGMAKVGPLLRQPRERRFLCFCSSDLWSAEDKKPTYQSLRGRRVSRMATD